MKTGDIILPLHGGKAPQWLMERMIKLSKSIFYLIVQEFGEKEVLRRLSDPIWFQSLGCLLGFDWHSSGVTTTVTYAIKEALRFYEEEFGIFVAGGKGKHALKVPDEIKTKAEKFGFDPEILIRSSKLCAKVDSVLLQDGYNLYLHAIVYTKTGVWSVIQQGMNERLKRARRYHWISESLSSFVEEPHRGIISEGKESLVLNLTAKESRTSREVILDISKLQPDIVYSLYLKTLSYKLPSRHQILIKDIKPENLKKILIKTYEKMPENFEDLIEISRLGPMSMRALALISDVIYGAKPSYTDPVVYTFAHGGKDGYPYPVRRDVYDKSIEVLERAIKLAKLGREEELRTLRKLQYLFGSK